MAFERLQSAIDDGIARKQHTCVQIFVSVNGNTLLNAGFGEAAAGISATADTIMHWRSAGKPLTAAAIVGLAAELQPSSLANDRALQTASPGGNMRGPISDLASFYEVLLHRGKLPDGTAFLEESSVELMTQRHRINRFDETLQHKVDMGLGCITNSRHHGPMVPYGFGEVSSPAAFGHGGAQCSMGFCDPAHGLAVAWAANGFCDEPQHQRRNRAINDAIYADLQLSS